MIWVINDEGYSRVSHEDNPSIAQSAGFEGNVTHSVSVTPYCLKNQFTCPTGSCLSLSQVCDFTKQCGNGEDEAECGKLSSCFGRLIENYFLYRACTHLIPEILTNYQIRGL